MEHFSFLAGVRPEWTEDEREWAFPDEAEAEEAAASGTVAVPLRIRDLLGRPVEDLAELSVRSRNSLQKENIQTVGDLVQRTEAQMLNIDNFGKKSLQEITEFLAEHGLQLGVHLERGQDGSLWWNPQATRPRRAAPADVPQADSENNE
jgi:DNA-directed RNA polymerase subunit alpha